MHFAKCLLLCATLVVSSTAVLVAFNDVPQSSIRAGTRFPLTWEGADDETVTILLKQGDPGDLQTVDGSSGIVTGNGRNGRFFWTVPSNLPEATYALQITRNVASRNTAEDNNFTGQFTISGGSASSSSSSASASSSSSRSAVVASTSSRAAVSSTTSVAPSAANVTITGRTTALPTGAVGTGASGTGASSIGRNSTHSRPSLSRASTSASASASSTSSETSETSSETSSETAPSSSPTGAAISLASNFALLCAAVIGVLYLG